MQCYVIVHNYILKLYILELQYKLSVWLYVYIHSSYMVKFFAHWTTDETNNYGNNHMNNNKQKNDGHHGI